MKKILLILLISFVFSQTIIASELKLDRCVDCLKNNSEESQKREEEWRKRYVERKKRYVENNKWIKWSVW